ncbi:serine/arginine repetitive matrix protein 1-like isoform X2 [Telopea speciosissima]|uniref:serine/arginine repetitive matrix protein 1-like isoform X2 n=1 Tax=Telopea speciosissima TaxID=54955 RepID=UPI001CC3A712|nr:serine/arginine repetitive matrix protein 1-like isoform X2 [Telopea speciosissima]
MSGGFFRGTSADQDTRFSNKQAKLMKSQKFASELDHVVDMTKVKIDTIKPWIAKRVTEILGFEDEVLINFIYGLLDRKDVNGKEVQIQLTGFMEKNTGKFMKELWTLLLSAQKNASGIPQQILDATDEELRKKKAEADRITHEIHKRKEKEGREIQLEKLKKMDVGDDELRANKAVPDAVLKHSQARDSSEEKEADKRNGSRKTNGALKSPNSVDRSPFSRSVSKSFSNSRSYSDERHRSRSMSRSPKPRERSISPQKRNRSPRRRSVSPRYRHSPRKPRSPLRQRSHHSRHRSSSYSKRRSLSPVRHRLSSPSRRRSPSPVRRRLRSPLRNRSPSPVRRRSPSPVRRRSRRSPSPPHRRSPPMRRRSPLSVRRRSPTPSRRRSPPRWSSPSPVRGRSPSPVRRFSPPRSPSHRRRSPLQSSRLRYRSRSPYKSRSPAYRSRRSLSRDRDRRSNGMESRSARDDYVSQRARGKTSPVRHTPKREVERLGQAHRGSDSESRQPRISLRSPQRDPTVRSNANQKKVAMAHSPEFSQSLSEPSPHMRKLSPHEDRPCDPSESPVRQGKETMSHDSPSPVRRPRKQIAHHDRSETSSEEEMSYAREDGDYRINSSERRIRQSPTFGHQNNYSVKDFQEKVYSPERVEGHQSAEAIGSLDNTELRKKDQDKQSLKASMGTAHSESPSQKDSTVLGNVEYGPWRPDGRSFVPDDIQDGQQSAKKSGRDSPSLSEKLQKSYSRECNKSEERKHSHSSNAEERDRGHKTEVLRTSLKKVDRKNRPGSSNSDSEENEEYRRDYMEKRKHKRSSRHEVDLDDNASYDDSEIDERKEAKRRRKEEKRLRKEERRRRREERHRRREERRASKLKAKSMDTVTPPSDCEKIRNDVVDSELDVDARKESNPSETEKPESEQKKLEIELRKKALESLRAKKGISH